MFDFKIKPDEGDEFELTAGSRDVLVWEKTTKGATFGSIAQGLRITDMYKIAWISAKRQNMFDGTLAEFESSVELEFEENEEPDPTRPAP
ncbi:hypothetical protein ACIA59_10635 [Micromonospora haikouensis]|uniref:hypothetical protein n=1 Tax=Micromonospora haikouensis TaxID=686309 RepID=UPI0037BC3D8D